MSKNPTNTNGGCSQLERTKWCEKLPLGHDEEACHEASQRRRDVLKMMKELVDTHVNRPVCPEWDTSTTFENTPGPYRFGVEKSSANQDNYKIIASQMTKGCECIKRNGLQDDCRLLECKGSPACRTTPFPSCGPSLGIPTKTSEVSKNKNPCRGPPTTPVLPSEGKNVDTSSGTGTSQKTQTAPVILSEGECICVCR